MIHRGKRYINIGGLWHSAVASQPCPSGHITTDKREIKDFPKLPSVTSFISRMLYAIYILYDGVVGVFPP